MAGLASCTSSRSDVSPWDHPFVGRDLDFAVLRGVFEKAAAERSVQLVTVVGEPGIGKSRLLAELGEYVDRLEVPVTWLQGRCLPYGDGITFWALGEIVKAHAGIYESDASDVAIEKLEAVSPGPKTARGCGHACCCCLVSMRMTRLRRPSGSLRGGASSSRSPIGDLS